LKYASQSCREEFEAFFLAEEDMPIGDRIVVFNGSYSVDQLQRRMARVDWCIVPSVWWEIFGLVISEAWMFKRPVIASNVGGPGERITHGKDGLLFNVADASSLAQAIRRACSEEGLWQRLVDGITPPPTARCMADGYLSIYQKRAREQSRALETAAVR
jgi:glycosyltransferase involved in cell wall biosynthesis